MRQRLGIRKIVGGDNFDIGIVKRSAHHVSADAAKPVYSDFDWHDLVYQLIRGSFIFWSLRYHLENGSLRRRHPPLPRAGKDQDYARSSAGAIRKLLRRFPSRP